VGELRGTGSDVSPALTATLLWMEVGVTGRGEVRLVGPLYGGVEVGATFPLVHDTFYFKPSQNVVHEVPAAGFVGAIELGLRVL
jgi:hypothetical protein